MRVEQIARGPSRQKRRKFSRCEFVHVEHQDPLSAVGPERDRTAALGRPEWDAQHEVQVDIEVSAPARHVLIPQVILASGVLARGAPDRECKAARDGLDRFEHLRPLREHRLPVSGPDVVEIDVDGKAREVEEEHVERRPALERQPVAQIRMSAELGDEVEQTAHLLDRVGSKALRSGDCPHRLARDGHRGSSHLRSTSAAGTNRFHLETNLLACLFASKA